MIHGEIDVSLTEDTGHAGIEALARFLAAGTGMIRPDDEGDPFSTLPANARHAFRELAVTYMRVIAGAFAHAYDADPDPDIVHESVTRWLEAEEL